MQRIAIAIGIVLTGCTVSQSRIKPSDSVAVLRKSVAIDAPARRKYVRVCEDCGLSVWARDEKARCACGREYDAAAEYEARIIVARDAWVTLLEASGASGTKLDTIKKWIRRGKIEAHGDPQRVRYGDVLDLAAAAKTAKERTA